MPGEGTNPLVVIGGDGSRCRHPVETLEYRGTDGRNGYHHCGECEAVLVLADVMSEISPEVERR